MSQVVLRGGARLRLFFAVALLFSLGVSATPATGQAVPSAGAQRASRTELAVQRAQLEQQLATGQLKGDRQSRARVELAALQARLKDGDFHVGDRFLLTIRTETERSDTIAVRDSLMVSVPGLPDVSLTGLLRSELNERLSTHVATYLRNSSVRTGLLTRVSVQGAVGRTGYYYAPLDRPLSDLLTTAGGQAPNARTDEFELRRGGVRLLSGKDSKRAIKEGKTLEQLDIQSGDEVRVPAKRGRLSVQTLVQLLFVFSSLFFAGLQFLQWYYGRQDA